MIQKISNQYRSAFADLPHEVWLLAAVMLINRLGMLVMPFISVYMIDRLHFDVVYAGLAFSSLGVGSLFGSLGGGWACEKWGVTKVQTYTLAWNGLIYAIMEHTTHIGPMLFCCFLIGFIGEAFRPANNAAVALFTPVAVRARAFGLNRLAMNLGMGLGPAYGGFLAKDHFEWIFRIDSITCFAAAFLVAYNFRNKTDRSLDKKEKDTESKPRWPFHDRVYMIALSTNLIYGFSLFMFFTIVPVFLSHYAKIDSRGFGFLLFLNGMIIILFEMLIAHRLESKNYLRWCAFGIFLNGLGFSFLALQPGWTTALLMLIFVTLAEMIFIPLFSAFVSNRASDRERGRYMGLFSLSFALSQIAAGVLGGWLFAHLPLAMWWMIGLLGLLGALVLFYQSLSHHGRDLYVAAPETRTEAPEPQPS